MEHVNSDWNYKGGIIYLAQLILGNHGQIVPRSKLALGPNQPPI